jgi:murein L,D-transpeptidase YafK
MPDKPIMTTARILPLIACGLALAAASPTTTVDHILIDKSDRTLSLLSGNQTVATYRDIKLGDAPVGPKHF